MKNNMFGKEFKVLKEVKLIFKIVGDRGSKILEDLVKSGHIEEFKK